MCSNTPSNRRISFFFIYCIQRFECDLGVIFISSFAHYVLPNRFFFFLKNIFFFIYTQTIMYIEMRDETTACGMCGRWNSFLKMYSYSGTKM